MVSPNHTVAPKHDRVVFKASWLAANINLSLPLTSPFIIHQMFYLLLYMSGCYGRIVTASISVGFLLLTTLKGLSDWLVVVVPTPSFRFILLPNKQKSECLRFA